MWQCGTIQLDFNLPERFDVTYIGEDGEKNTDLLCYTELYTDQQKDLQVYLQNTMQELSYVACSVQVKILTINDECIGFANEIKDKLQDLEIRAEVDDRTETIGYKIRGKMENIKFLCNLSQVKTKWKLSQLMSEDLDLKSNSNELRRFL